MNYQLAMNEEILKEFGKKLKSNRIKANLSQEEVAKNSGISRKAVSEMERGITNFKVVNLLEVMRAIGVANNFNDLLADIPLLDPIEIAKLESRIRKRVRK